jgi:hypothetical protein
MNYLRKLGLLAMASMALWLIGGSAASATELYKYTAPNPNDTLGAGTSIKGSLKAGTSLLRKETTGLITDTCTSWGLEGTIASAGGEISHPVIGLSSMNIGGCVNAMKFLKPGELEVRHITGTTNGEVYLKNAEVTWVDTGSLIDCVAKIEAATYFGRLTGSSGSTSLDVNWMLPAVGFCGDRKVEGTLSITSPTGLVVEAK